MNLHRLYLIPTTGELDAPNVWPLHAGDRYDGLSLMATDEPIITRYGWVEREVTEPAEQLAVLYVAAFGRWPRDGGVSPSNHDAARFMIEMHAVADAYGLDPLADLLDNLGEIGSDEQQIGAHLMANSPQICHDCGSITGDYWRGDPDAADYSAEAERMPHSYSDPATPNPLWLIDEDGGRYCKGCCG